MKITNKKKIESISTGAILGIIFGVVGFTIITIAIVYIIKKRSDILFDNELKKIENMEMKSNPKSSSWKVNEKHEKQNETKWKDFEN